MEQLKEVKKPAYIFPQSMAEFMSKIDQRTQYEASMMSMTLMLIGMILTVIYMVIYMDFQLWFKIVMVINGLCGLVFMSSYLITTYQQYLSYMQVVEFQKKLEELKLNQDNTRQYFQ